MYFINFLKSKYFYFCKKNKKKILNIKLKRVFLHDHIIINQISNY